MNERIRQLLGQAYDEAVPETWTELSSIQLGRIYDKFAELIVEECIREIGYKSVELLDIDFYPHYQERLKKHFGVEE
jgi:hypothetical protein